MTTEDFLAFGTCHLTARQKNAKFVEGNPECQRIINGLKKIAGFLESFDWLTSSRGFICGPFGQNIGAFSLSVITTSLEMTMENVIACCESACIADANTLLRKYRDDLFFFLYISVYRELDWRSEKAKSMANQIAKWLNNNLQNLSISKVLMEIATDSHLSDVVLKYKLKDSFEKISSTLNNYVHSNGHSYYNRSTDAYTEKVLITELGKLEENARYITVVSLLLLILCSPISVMSETYIDYLDCNMTPPEDSQYWVDGHVEHFVKENISLIDENCLAYLREKTMMQI